MESSDSHDAQVQVPNQLPQAGSAVPANAAAMAKPGVFAPGTIVGASYEVIELLGRGAMGMVYRVKHVTLPAEYALKILTDDKQDDVSVIRFQNEAQAIAKLNHPNIVAIYNFGLHDGSLPFYVMDLLAGEDLLDKIVCSGPMAPDAALPLFIEACAGLSFAHRKGILHRDVKPANLLILDRPDVHGASVKVVDFGIVKFAEELKPDSQKLTAMGIVCGSPSYMSPEQAMGQKVDPRSDIYSLGCSLFETLTGKVPFRGRSASDTMMMHVSAPTPSLASKNPEAKFSDDLEILVARMMAKERMYRYQTMDAVAQDLKNLLEGKPLASTPFVQTNFGGSQGRAEGAIESSPAQGNLTQGNLTQGNLTQGNLGRVPTKPPFRQDEPLFDGRFTADDGRFTGEQDASGEYESEESDEERDEEGEFGRSSNLKIVVFSLVVLSLIGIACFFVMQPQKRSVASPTQDQIQVRPSQTISELKLESNDLKKELHLDDVSPESEAAAASVELTKARYFSKLIDVGGQKYVQFSFPPKGKARPFAYIGTSMKDKADAFGEVKFPRNKPIYLVPSPNLLLKKEFFSKFRPGEITEVILWPLFASDELAIESVKVPGIKGYSIGGCTELTPAIIPALQSLTDIQSFDATRSPLKGSELAKLRFLPNLKVLALSHCVEVTPILRVLKGSINLESLAVSDTGIGASDYRLIASLPRLKALMLDGNKISAEDLHQLSRLKHLRELSLVNVHMMGGSAARELVRFPALRILIVDKGHFNKEDLAALREHVPDLRIQFFSGRQNFLGEE